MSYKHDHLPNQIFRSLRSRPRLRLPLISRSTELRAENTVGAPAHRVSSVGSQLPSRCTHGSSTDFLQQVVSRTQLQLFSNCSLLPSSPLGKVHTQPVGMLRGSILNPQEGWLPGLGPPFPGRCRCSIQEGNVEMYTQGQPRHLQFRQLKGPPSTSWGRILPTAHRPSVHRAALPSLPMR